MTTDEYLQEILKTLQRIEEQLTFRPVEVKGTTFADYVEFKRLNPESKMTMEQYDVYMSNRGVSIG